MSALRLSTLGTLRLTDSTGEDLGGRRKELMLLAFITRRAPCAVPRAELAALLWGERDEARARHSLRQALLRLRRAVGEGLVVDPDEVRLDAGTIELDVNAFEEDIASGRFREAVSRWNGEFLREAEDTGGEGYRAWLESERERLRQKLAWALERLAEEAAERAAWGEAAGWAEQWAQARPFDERTHRRWIELLRLAGNPADALAHQAAFASRLREEIDIEPTAEFLRLRDEIVVDRERTGSPRPGSAALFTPDMVGRGAAFAELVAAWREVGEGRCAAVLIEGEEGIGKTRLCAEFLRWLDDGLERAERRRRHLRSEGSAHLETHDAGRLTPSGDEVT